MKIKKNIYIKKGVDQFMVLCVVCSNSPIIAQHTHNGSVPLSVTNLVLQATNLIQ